MYLEKNPNSFPVCQTNEMVTHQLSFNSQLSRVTNEKGELIMHTVPGKSFSKGVSAS